MTARGMVKAAAPWLIAFGGAALVTAAGYGIGLNANAVGFAYLVVVLFASLRGGLAAGTCASVVATLAYNYFYLPPLHTFRVDEPANWIALAAFLATSVIVSRLVIDARIQAEHAEWRRNELETLYGLSVALLSATNRTGALGEAAGRALTLLGAREGGLVLFDGSPYRQNIVWWSGGKGDEIADVIAGIGRHCEPLELPSPLGRDVYLPLLIGGAAKGVLAARGTEASVHALVPAAGLVALAVERETFLEEKAHLDALRDSDGLKTSLLRAISHDLTTPLTAISIHTETLRRSARSDAESQAPIKGIAGETSRLRRRIDNLLAMARLEAGKARPRREPIPPADLFRAVRDNLPLVFESRAVHVHVDEHVADVEVDPSLALEILVNLIENAHRVARPGTALELTAAPHPDDPSQVRLEMLDRGPGLPPGMVDANGNLLPRAMSDLPQQGLGLEIARSLAIANGGSVALVPRPGGGAIARLDLPAAPMPAGTESR